MVNNFFYCSLLYAISKMHKKVLLLFKLFFVCLFYEIKKKVPFSQMCLFLFSKMRLNNFNSTVIKYKNIICKYLNILKCFVHF